MAQMQNPKSGLQSLVIIASFLCNIHKKIPDDEFVSRSHSEPCVNDPMNNEDDLTSRKETFISNISEAFYILLSPYSILFGGVRVWFDSR